MPSHAEAQQGKFQIISKRISLHDPAKSDLTAGEAEQTNKRTMAGPLLYKLWIRFEHACESETVSTSMR